MCDICNKAFKHIVDHRKRVHKTNTKDASMVVRGERRRQCSQPKRQRKQCPFPTCSEPVVRIRKHLESGKHGMRYGTHEYNKMVMKFDSKVTSPVKRILLTDQNTVKRHELSFREYCEDALTLSQTPRKIGRAHV